MTTMTRWNPLKASNRFDPLVRFEDMFRGLTTTPQWRDLVAAPEVRIDVTENDKAFLIKADMPGIDKKDVEVSADGNQVTISAEVRHESSDKEGKETLYTERYYGKVYRSFTLPGEFDSAKAKAHYENGVLALSLPKKANGSSRKIKVS